jgi:hypothetical protein
MFIRILLIYFLLINIVNAEPISLSKINQTGFQALESISPTYAQFNGQDQTNSKSTEGSNLTQTITSWFSIQANFAYNHWIFKPIDIKTEEGENTDWSNVTTEEEYDITPLNLYNFSVKLSLPFFDLETGYQSNRGAFVKEEQTASDAINFLLDFKKLPIIKNFSFQFKTLDFNQGKVFLKDRLTKEVIDEAEFNLEYTFAELKYKSDKKDLLKYLFVRYADYSIPRNIYLQKTVGEDDNTQFFYYQLSNELFKVNHSFIVAGGNIDISDKVKVNGKTIKRMFNKNLLLTSRIALGGGTYELTSLRTNQEVADSSTLIAVLFGFELNYTFDITNYVRLGIKDTLDFQFFGTSGLPSDVESRFKAQGIDTKDLSLDFGTIDMFNTAYVYIDIGPKKRD